MGMIVEKAAMGLQTEDPAAQAIADLQELRKISLPGLPCCAAAVCRVCSCVAGSHSVH